MIKDLAEQVQYFQSLPHKEQLQKVKGILEILWDNIEDLRGLKDTINTFWEEASSEELSQIFENIVWLVQKFQQENN